MRSNRSSRMIETLEDRRLLAGDVSVAYDAETNTIEVEGDSAANAILVSGNLDVGYTVTGLDGTTVNGDTDPVTLLTTDGQRANVAINLGAGNDDVELNNLAGLAIEVATGSGDDDVTVFNVTAFEGIEIATASGDDDVSLDFVDIHEGLDIALASGDDDVTFGGSITGVTLFSGDVHISGASGDDTVTGRANVHFSGTGQKFNAKKMRFLA